MPVAKEEVLEVAGRQVTISNPDKVFFPKTGHTKLDLVRYYMAVAEGALRGVWGRPMALKRFVNGLKVQPSSRSARRARGRSGSRRSSCRFHPGAPRKRSWSGMRRNSPGSSISVAST